MGNSESKSRFRESLYTLGSEEISSSNIDFWDRLWKIPSTAEEIFTLIQPDDVRTLKKNKPLNLKTMYAQAVSQLTQIVRTPVPKFYPQAVNCIRVLTRLTSFILEDVGSNFIHECFWKIDEEVDENNHKEEAREETKTTAQNGVQSRDPLGKQLVYAIMGLLFLPDFTVTRPAYEAYQEQIKQQSSSSLEEEGGEDRVAAAYGSLLWCGGVGYSDVNPHSAPAMNRNRKEVLKLLLTLFSGSLYQHPESYDPYNNPFLEMATSKDCPFLRTLFHSLFNIILSYNPVGWGIPYAGNVFINEREELVDIAAQVFVTLLDFGESSPTSAPSSTNGAKKKDRLAVASSSNVSDSPASTAPAQHQNPNIYRYLLSTLKREEDFEFIHSGLTKLLNNYYEALNTFLPNSISRIQCHQELLVILWKLLDENDAFLRFSTKKKPASALVVPILFLMNEGRKEPSKVGMIHICTFILLFFSGERDFCVSLNQPFNQRLPTDLPLFEGTVADLVIITLHKLIVSGYERLNSVYNCFLTVISNISPYCKKLSMASSVRLLRLFKLFSQPRYLYDNESNHHLLNYLLDTLNNIIQYQYEGNAPLVYSICQNQSLFLKLKALPLPTSTAATATTVPDHHNETTTTSGHAVPLSEQGRTMPSSGPKIRHEEAMHPIQPSSAQFVPTAEWVMSWKKKLPMITIFRLLKHLVPLLDEAMEKAGGSLDESEILQFLRGSTMVGLLPVPHAIVIRKYQPNQMTNLWFTTFAWGVIFLRNQDLPLFDGSTITLFTINILQES